MRFTFCMKRLFLLSLFVIAITETPAQYFDSLSIVNSNWRKERIAKGVKLYSKHFSDKSLFKSNQYITYLEIKRGAGVFDIAADPKVLKKTSEFANENDAIAAINGNFFDIKNGGAVDYTKKDGKVININRNSSGYGLAFHQKAAVVIHNGKPDIIKWDGFVNWEENLKEEHVMLNGPLLILDHKTEKLDSGSFNLTRHPRTAFGITKRGRAIMLVVDGRNINSNGLSNFELAKVMRWLKCRSAINFDGGGSTTLWVKGKGVMNHPADNAKWDHAGERRVANILFLRKK